MPRQDFAKLEHWTRLFNSGHVLTSATNNAMAEEMVGLIKDGFRTETDPYGKKWKPKKKPDGRKTLSGKTSRLKGGWHVKRKSDSSFTVAPSVDYATPHQTGAPSRNLVPRRMVPTQSRGLPGKWSKAFKEVALLVARAFYSTKPGQKAKTKTAKKRARS